MNLIKRKRVFKTKYLALNMREMMPSEMKNCQRKELKTNKKKETSKKKFLLKSLIKKLKRKMIKLGIQNKNLNKQNFN